MPRSVAILLGLVLAAVSIGFNTVQYPVVWEMACPVRASEPAPPVATTPPSKPDSPPSPPAQPPVKPPEKPATPIEVKPVREATDKIVIDDKQKTTKGVTSNNAGAGHKEAAAQPEPQKSLVPIVPVSSSHEKGNEVAGGAGIRRLPPVDAVNVTAAGQALPTTGNSIPIYPTTGIE